MIDTKSAAFDTHPIDARYSQLNTEMRPIDVGSELHQMLDTYLQQTHATTHSQYTIKLEQAFEVRIEARRDACIGPEWWPLGRREGDVVRPQSPPSAAAMPPPCRRHAAAMPLPYGRPATLLMSDPAWSESCYRSIVRVRRRPSSPRSATGSFCGTARASPIGVASSRGVCASRHPRRLSPDICLEKGARAPS